MGSTSQWIDQGDGVNITQAAFISQNIFSYLFWAGSSYEPRSGQVTNPCLKKGVGWRAMLKKRELMTTGLGDNRSFCLLLLVYEQPEPHGS